MQKYILNSTLSLPWSGSYIILQLYATAQRICLVTARGIKQMRLGPFINRWCPGNSWKRKSKLSLHLSSPALSLHLSSFLLENRPALLWFSLTVEHAESLQESPEPFGAGCMVVANQTINHGIREIRHEQEIRADEISRVHLKLGEDVFKELCLFFLRTVIQVGTRVAHLLQQYFLSMGGR